MDESIPRIYSVQEAAEVLRVFERYLATQLLGPPFRRIEARPFVGDDGTPKPRFEVISTKARPSRSAVAVGIDAHE